MSRRGPPAAPPGGMPLEGAVPFLQSDGRIWRVCPEAVDILRDVRGKVAIVTVAGKYRSGKSYLLNRLIGSNRGGFSVGHTIEAHTKGLWIWGRPIIDGDTTYIFVDSEGLGSLDRGNKFDAEVFCLSILLSSLLVLNSTSVIDEQSLQQLELVVQCTKQIRINADNQQPQSAADLSKHFPNFLWVLRDFSLQLGEGMSSTDYLERCLRPMDNGKKGAEEQNRIRETIRGVFPRRDCYTLVRPAADERVLNRLNTMASKDLRPEFEEQIRNLGFKIKDMAPAKKVHDSFVDGRALVALAQAYVGALNKGGMPSIKSAWTFVVELQLRDAFQDAQAVFTREFLLEVDRRIEAKDGAAFDLDELAALFNHAKVATGAVFDKRAVGGESEQQMMKVRLFQELDKAYKDKVTVNGLKSTDSCRRLMERVWESEKGDARLAVVTSAEELADLKAKVAGAYLKVAKGPAKDEVLRSWLDNKQNGFNRTVLERSQHIAEEIAGLKRKLVSMDNEIEMRRKEAFDARNDANVHQQTVRRLELQLEQYLQHDLQRKRDMEQNDRNLAMQMGQLDKLQQELAQARADLRVAQDTLGRSARGRDDEVQALQREGRTAQAELENLRHKYSERETQYAREMQRLQAAVDTAREKDRVRDRADGADSALVSRLQGDIAGYKQELNYERNNAAVLRKDVANILEDIKLKDKELKLKDMEVATYKKKYSDLLAEPASSSSFSSSSSSSGGGKWGVGDAFYTSAVSPARSSSGWEEASPFDLGSSSSSSSSSKKRPRPSLPPRQTSSVASIPDPTDRGDLPVPSFHNPPDLTDPSKLTVPDLKKWLTRINVPLPQGNLKKDEWVQLVHRWDHRLSSFSSASSASSRLATGVNNGEDGGNPKKLQRNKK